MPRRVNRAIWSLLTLGFMPRAWRWPCFSILGAFVGLGMAVGSISRAPSYMSDDPEACVNCHVMTPQYASWQHSSHANVATCNDCHVPHDTVFNEYAFKARDGLYHSYIFTLRLEPQVIHISDGAVPVVQANCQRCHSQVIEEVNRDPFHSGEQVCWECHREVPHGRSRSLSSTPRIMDPQLPPIGDPQPPTIGGRPVRPQDGETP